ncbi:hypothetical protein D9M71_795150 [compost metagenome]
MFSSGSGAGRGMRIFQRVPPSSRAKHCPLGSATTCAGSISGTLAVLTRSCAVEVKSVGPWTSELSVAPLTRVVV